jgi:hypothetical protein
LDGGSLDRRVDIVGKNWIDFATIFRNAPYVPMLTGQVMADLKERISI